MIHVLWYVAAGIVSAMAGYGVANRVVKRQTGLDIHTHFVQWWNKLYGEIQQWLHVHRHLKVARVLAVATRQIDEGVMVAHRMIRVIFRAEIPEADPMTIVERALTEQEALELIRSGRCHQGRAVEQALTEQQALDLLPRPHEETTLELKMEM